MAIVYRRAGAAEREAIEALFRAENELTPYGLTALDDPRLIAWVALDGAATVAAILTRPMLTDDSNERGGVDELLVAGEYRGTGVGRRLMNLAESYYRGRGLHGMQLTVAEGNKAAVRLYQSLGYRVNQRRLRMWKDFGDE